MCLIRHDLVPMLIAASLPPLRACRVPRRTEPSPVTEMLSPLGLYAAP